MVNIAQKITANFVLPSSFLWYKLSKERHIAWLTITEKHSLISKPIMSVFFLKLLSICILISNFGYNMGTSDFNGLVDIPECLVGLDLNIKTGCGFLHPVSTRAIWGDCIWEWFYWKTQGCFSWNRKQNQDGFLKM